MKMKKKKSILPTVARDHDDKEAPRQTQDNPKPDDTDVEHENVHRCRHCRKLCFVIASMMSIMIVAVAIGNVYESKNPQIAMLRVNITLIGALFDCAEGDGPSMLTNDQSEMATDGATVVMQETNCCTNSNGDPYSDICAPTHFLSVEDMSVQTVEATGTIGWSSAGGAKECTADAQLAISGSIIVVHKKIRLQDEDVNYKIDEKGLKIYERDSSGKWFDTMSFLHGNFTDNQERQDYGIDIEIGNLIIVVSEVGWGGGCIHIYRRNKDWEQEATLCHDISRFGSSVAVSGNDRLVAVGGASGVLVYKYNPFSKTWTEHTRMDDPNHANAILAFTYDDHLLIGKPSAKSYSGVVSFYTRSTKGYRLRQTIASSSNEPGESMGATWSGMAVSENVMIAGTEYSHTVYVFTRMNGVWSEAAKIEPPFDANPSMDVHLAGNDILLSIGDNIYHYRMELL